MSCFNNGRRAGGKGGSRESEKRSKIQDPRDQEKIDANKMTSKVRRKITLTEKRNRARLKTMFSEMKPV